MNRIFLVLVCKRLTLALGFFTLSLAVEAQYMPDHEPAAKPVNPSQPQFPSASQVQESKLTYKIIEALNGTFGYQVHADGRLLINQTSIPALPGNNGFRTRQQAAKVAELVITKIRKGEMPPTVMVEDLKKLGVHP